jgi:hypothetical protein
MAMKLVRLEKAGAVTTVFPKVRARHNCCAGAASQPRRPQRRWRPDARHTLLLGENVVQ